MPEAKQATLTLQAPLNATLLTKSSKGMFCTILYTCRLHKHNLLYTTSVTKAQKNIPAIRLIFILLLCIWLQNR